MTTHAKPQLKRPTLEVTAAESTIDVRLWARHYVAVLLELEGVSITPTAISEAS